MIFWIVLFVGIVALIGSCSKKDDKKAASGCSAVVNSCSAIATADNITGVSTGWISGTYNPYVTYSSLIAVDNATGCVSAAGYIASGPTGTNSLNQWIKLTGPTTFSTSVGYYSDSNCSSPIFTYAVGRSELTVGDNLSSLSYAGKPTTATKFTYKESCMEIYPYNEVGATYANQLFGTTGKFVAGTKSICATNQTTYHGMWNIADSTWDAAANDNRSLTILTDGTTAFTTWASGAADFIRLD